MQDHLRVFVCRIQSCRRWRGTCRRTLLVVANAPRNRRFELAGIDGQRVQLDLVVCQRICSMRSLAFFEIEKANVEALCAFASRRLACVAIVATDGSTAIQVSSNALPRERIRLCRISAKTMPDREVPLTSANPVHLDSVGRSLIRPACGHDGNQHVQVRLDWQTVFARNVIRAVVIFRSQGVGDSEPRSNSSCP